MYQEELKIGHEFEVNISMETRAPKKVVTSIEHTINYVEVYRIVQEVFGKRRQLLETCAMEIGEHLYEAFPGIEKLVITIRKIAPPITNFTGSVAVTYSRTFK